MRDGHPKNSGPDTKLQRRIENERLPVDTCREGPPGIDLEGRRGPLVPRAMKKAASLTASGGRPYYGDTEQAVVDARTRARADRTTEAVAVVGDEHGSTPAVSVPARPAPAHIEIAATCSERVGHGVQQGPELGGAV